jgi:hypothetical protein
VDASGDPTVTALSGDDPSDGSVVRLDAAALAALYLGGVSAVTLARARRLQASPDDAAALDRTFRASVAPTLGVWF